MAADLDDVYVECPRPGVAVVIFAGKHDVATSPAISYLLEGLTRANASLVADFTSATFVDTSVLRVLFAAEERASELGKEFRIQLT
jgi:anti-anti-sigma regulatory factor